MSDAYRPPVRISRQKARERVSFGDPVVIHESSRKRVVFIPFFIRRSDGTDLAIKLQSYRKGNPPNDWLLVDDRSISLPESAARALLGALRSHFALADQEHEDGQSAFPQLWGCLWSGLLGVV